ncbi:MAG: hypothetical protein AAGG75_28140 [Bacteroidota bacterium]
MAQKIVGVLPPIYIPGEEGDSTVQLGEDYFFMKVVDMQLAYHGRFGEQAKQILLVSNVAFDHPKIGQESVSSLRKIQKLKRNTSLKVGFSQNLTNLLPCVIPSIKLGFELIVDNSDKFEDLQKIVNNDYFTTAIGFATGEMEVAKTLSKLSQGIIGYFLDSDKQKTLLHFNGEFNFFNGSIKEGYYLIIGSQNKKYPLPPPTLAWTIHNGQVQAEGFDLKDYSYFVIKLGKVKARTRYLSLETDWNKKLNQAEDLLKNLDRFSIEKDSYLKDRWDQCLSLLKEAQVLIRNDVNFLPREADQIINASFHFCEQQLEATQPQRSRDSANQPTSPLFSAAFLSEGRQILGIEAEEDLEAPTLEYTSAIRKSRQFFKKEGWL